MNFLHPARIGAALRGQLINMGEGARLLWRLLSLMGPDVATELTAHHRAIDEELAAAHARLGLWKGSSP